MMGDSSRGVEWAVEGEEGEVVGGEKKMRREGKEREERAERVRRISRERVRRTVVSHSGQRTLALSAHRSPANRRLVPHSGAARIISAPSQIPPVRFFSSLGLPIRPLPSASSSSLPSPPRRTPSLGSLSNPSGPRQASHIFLCSSSTPICPPFFCFLVKSYTHPPTATTDAAPPRLRYVIGAHRSFTILIIFRHSLPNLSHPPHSTSTPTRNKQPSFLSLSVLFFCSPLLSFSSDRRLSSRQTTREPLELI
ncbi:hypothetical protein FKP32DRAFT_1590914, partial [Trametes sanguinea]